MEERATNQYLTQQLQYLASAAIGLVLCLWALSQVRRFIKGQEIELPV
jgi:hypothetical protein